MQDPLDLKTEQTLKNPDLQDLTAKLMFKVQDAQDPAA